MRLGGSYWIDIGESGKNKIEIYYGSNSKRLLTFYVYIIWKSGPLFILFNLWRG